MTLNTSHHGRSHCKTTDLLSVVLTCLQFPSQSEHSLNSAKKLRFFWGACRYQYCFLVKQRVLSMVDTFKIVDRTYHRRMQEWILCSEYLCPMASTLPFCFFLVRFSETACFSSSSLLFCFEGSQSRGYQLLNFNLLSFLISTQNEDSIYRIHKFK